jgi:ABC-type antimicrobial peptide transport system permease subunit
MNSGKQFLPPRWASRLLQWYCKPALLEDLQGDLNEYFQRNIRMKGLFRARVIYIVDVLKFFRLYTVRKPEFLNLLIHWIMIGSYIRTSGRSIVRHKLFSAINIVGLAISMSVGLLMIGMITDLSSYDRFHEKHDRIFRVLSLYKFEGQSNNEWQATTSLKAAKEIRESFSGIEDVAILKRDFRGDLSVDDKTVPLSGLWANESFFNVFSFELIQGNPGAALKAPFSVVLTETSARKLFGDTNAMGKVVTLPLGDDKRQYTVSGVVKDPPVFSHMKFDMLGSLSTREIIAAKDEHEMRWDNVWHTWAYVLLPDKQDLQELQKNLDRLTNREEKTVAKTRIEFRLQPVTDIITGEGLSNQIGTTMGSTVIWIFTGLALVVVLCAGLNYTNLSIARTIRRSREVGIRKTIGAQRSHVVNQFITESVMISLLALLLGFGMFVLLKPHFLNLEGSMRELLALDLSPELILLFLAFAVVVGISAGIFPALFFARINPVKVLKNLSAVPVFKGVTLRKGLVVFQYCISIMAISTTFILHKQYNHFIAYDLGFTTENILNIRLQGNKAELVKKELAEMPEVTGVSQSLIVTSIGYFYGTLMKNPSDPLDSAGVNYNFIDENYLPLHEHKLLAGQNFKAKPAGHPESEVIVNEAVLKRFNIADQKPEKAIGQVIRLDGKDLTIIGVMRDFQYGRANNQPGTRVVMRYRPAEAQYLNVKILSSDWPKTRAKIEAIWKKFDRVHPLDAKFYDDQIEANFEGMKASMNLASFLAFLVICISSIGLLGMVVYSTETRVREVSIRKVFGATEAGLLYILSRGFLLLLLISAAIALPVTYLFFDQVLLPGIANHAPLEFFELSAGVVIVILVALVMITTQTIKVARANPAEILKTD